MANEALLRIKVITDATQAAMGLDKAGQNSSKFAQNMQKAALPAAAVGVAVGVMAKKAVDAASKMQQSTGAIEAVFGDASGAVEKYAKSAATTMGLSAADYQNYAALVGTSLQNAGFSAAESAAESNKAMQRAADMSALYGGTTAEAVDAINAAVSRSEFDPLDKYGVTLNMASVNAALAAKGQDKLTGAALEAAKKQEILSQVYSQSAKSAGQYAREADSVSGRQQTMAAETENAAAALGTILLPVMASAAKALGVMATWAGKNTTAVQILVGVIAGLAVAVLAINAAMKVYAAYTAVATAVTNLWNNSILILRARLIAMAAAEKIVAAAQWAWNAALSANPIGLIIIAVVALVAAIVLLWKNCEGFRTAVTAVWNVIKAGAVAMGHAIANVWKKISSAATSAFNFIKNNWKTMLALITGPLGIAVALIIRNWDKIKSTATSAFSKVASVIGNIKSAIDRTNAVIATMISKMLNIRIPGTVKGAIDAIKNAIDKVIDAVKSLINWIKDIPIPKIDWPSPPKWLSKVIPGAFSAPAPAARSATAPAVTGRAAAVPLLSATGGAGMTIINVNGAIDPESTARAVSRVMGAHYRRIGQGAASRGLRTA